MKFWKAAIWSNFSAHRPAIRPSEPISPAPRIAKASTHSGLAMPGGANHTVAMNTPAPTISPRITDAPT